MDIDQLQIDARATAMALAAVDDRLFGKKRIEGRRIGAAQQAHDGDGHIPVGQATGRVDPLAAGILPHGARAMHLPGNETVEHDRLVDGRIERDGEDGHHAPSPSSARTSAALVASSARAASP